MHSICSEGLSPSHGFQPLVLACTAKLMQRSMIRRADATAFTTSPIERIPSCCYAQEIVMAMTQCCRSVEAVSSRVALLSVTWTEQSEYGPCYCP